ncbi:uncharacterized protein [Diabrotica undecimpunctata]|uniref:uncharacterized protein n=1 Tax=Diabrotica undecimpunctata TaxID=50387 RepID=UPI003B63CA2F
MAEQIFVDSTVILPDERYQVDMPFRTNNYFEQLGDSLAMARNRFFNLEKKLGKNKVHFAEYKSVIEEYLQLNHAKVIPLERFNNNLNKYFLPHFAVIREESLSTKVRIVFDVSGKKTTGLSLNDTMLKGYQVQPNLYDILLRFRTFKFVLVGDVEKMFRQIQINPNHRFLLNILWRNNVGEQLSCIEMQRLTFGTNCAPFLATRVLKDIADKNKDNYPIVSLMLTQQTYMDDIIAGCDTIGELNKLNIDLNTVLNKSGFTLQKVVSNSTEISKNYHNRAKNSELQDVDLSKEHSNKVLGLRWNSVSDSLSFVLPVINKTGPITERKVLSLVAQCFDPMGLLTPFIVRGKILIQKLWLLKLDWDSEITEPHLLKIWKEFCSDFSELKKISIPRLVFVDKNISQIELHAFCDARVKPLQNPHFIADVHGLISGLVSVSNEIPTLTLVYTCPLYQL